jgi:hypothetical protein
VNCDSLERRKSTAIADYVIRYGSENLCAFGSSPGGDEMRRDSTFGHMHQMLSLPTYNKRRYPKPLMDERLSLKAVDDYSEDYASKVVASFFSQKPKITGPEILKLCSVQQINMFVVRELLGAWHHEGQKLHSPYFDYSAKAVQDELVKLQNILSNNISISRENFQPLLKKAVSQTIYLVIDPYDFFSDVLDRKGSGHVRASDLKNDIKYLKINKAPLEMLVRRLQEKGLDLISGKEAFGMLDQILEEVHFTPEDVDSYLKEFSSVVPLKPESLYEAKQQPTIKKSIAPEPPKKSKAKIETDGKSLVDSYQKIMSIKDSLTINQKFMFTKILFKGDFEIFSEAIERLDRAENMEQVMKYVDDNYPEWDRESEEYEEFIELVGKKFA